VKVLSWNIRHGFVEVEVEGWATIGAVYGPLQRVTLRAFWHHMVRHASRRADGRYLLIGDFNAGSRSSTRRRTSS
jgi:hypothetical protein